MLRWYGEHDRRLPFKGGKSCDPGVGGAAARDSLFKTWKKVYACEDDGAEWGSFPGATCREHECKRGSLTRCAVNVGNRWPGTEAIIPVPSCEFSQKGPQFPFADAFWQFFDTQGLLVRRPDLDEVEIVPTGRGPID